MPAPTPLLDLDIGLDDLIVLVHEVHPEGDELRRLSDAALVAAQLDELGHHLLGHFVDQARQAGNTWSAIGSSMGVTKQAVQKRFVPVAGDVSGPTFMKRFTPRARNAVDRARDAAREMASAHVGTEHLVLGLMSEREGIAAKTIEAAGLSPALVREKVEAAQVEKVKPPSGRIPFSSASKKVLKLAVREALRMGHNYIGTEHVLLGVLAEGESLGARALSELGLSVENATQIVMKKLAEASGKSG